MVCFFQLFKNFPQFTVIHTVKGLSVVSEAEVDVFLEFPCFSHNPMDEDNLIFAHGCTVLVTGPGSR